MTGPEHYREAERLAKQADTWENADTGWKGQLSVEERIARRMTDLAAAQVHATLAGASTQDPTATAVELETEPAAYVYRAAWGTTPLGTYTNAEAARMHCEDDALNHNPEFDGRVFDWLGDESEPDSPYELVITKGDDEEPTEYMVTRITVASEYDPEADA